MLFSRPFYNSDSSGGSGTIDYSANWAPMTEDTTTVVEETAIEVAPAEQVEPAVEVATPAVESQVQQATTATPADAPAQAATQPQETKVEHTPWEEAIKTVDRSKVLSQLGSREEILKTLGVPEMLIQMEQHYKNTGNLTDYVRAISVDYDKMSLEDLVRDQISKENPGAPKAYINQEVEEALAKFNVPEDATDDQKAIAAYKAKKMEDSLRASGKEAQAKFVLDSKQVTPISKDDIIKEYETSRAAENAAGVQKVRADIDAHPETKKLLAKKTLQIADGLNFGVEGDIEKILSLSSGEGSFFGLFRDDNGNILVDKWYEVLAFALNTSGFKQQLMNHGVTQANRAKIDEGSSSHPEDVMTAPQKKSYAAMFNEPGVVETRF